MRSFKVLIKYTTATGKRKKHESVVESKNPTTAKDTAVRLFKLYAENPEGVVISNVRVKHTTDAAAGL